MNWPRYLRVKYTLAKLLMYPNPGTPMGPISNFLLHQGLFVVSIAIYLALLARLCA